MKLKFILILIVSSKFLFSQGVGKIGTVLIVERPENLAVFDTYQRTVPPEVKLQWGQFLPFEIGKAVTLPDQITQALRVKLQNQDLFMLIDSIGNPQGLEQTGFFRWYYRVRVFNDTMKIKNGQKLILLHPVSWQTLKTLSAGQTVIRVFKRGVYYYVRAFDSPVRYAWCKISSSRVWEKVKAKDLQKEAQFHDFVQQLKFCLTRKNRVYANLYHYFVQTANLKSDDRVPQWKLEQNEREVRIIFNRPEYLKSWSKSTKIFIDELKKLSAQYGFELKTVKPGVLKITKRTDS